MSPEGPRVASENPPCPAICDARTHPMEWKCPAQGHTDSHCWKTPGSQALPTSAFPWLFPFPGIGDLHWALLGLGGTGCGPPTSAAWGNPRWRCPVSVQERTAAWLAIPWQDRGVEDWHREDMKGLLEVWKLR